MFRAMEEAAVLDTQWWLHGGGEPVIDPALCLLGTPALDTVRAVITKIMREII
jgi:hypothetical protein